MELFGSNRQFVSSPLWCTAKKNWAPKATIKNGPEGDGRLRGLVYLCCTPEGMQKKKILLPRNADFKCTPSNLDGFFLLIEGKVVPKAPKATVAFGARFFGTRSWNYLVK